MFPSKIRKIQDKYISSSCLQQASDIVSIFLMHEMKLQDAAPKTTISKLTFEFQKIGPYSSSLH